VRFLYWLQFLRSLNSLELFCLYISCVIILWDARDISFAALRLSGERSHCVLVFPRVSFFEMSRGGVSQW
jgi:hypothetical protein